MKKNQSTNGRVSWIQGCSPPTGTKIITPRKAKKLLAEADPDLMKRLQRKVTPKHVEHLAQLLLSNEYTIGHITIARVGDKKGVANGQHSLHAMVHAGVGAHCTYHETTCPDEEAWSRLFHGYDAEDRQRSLTECAKAYAVGHDLACTAKELHRFRHSYECWRVQGGVEKASTKHARFADALSAAGHLLPTFVEMHDLGEKAHLKLRFKAPVGAAWIETLTKNRKKAQRFWKMVLTRAGYDDLNDPNTFPPHRLGEWLRSIKRVATGGGNAGKTHIAKTQDADIASQADVYNRCMEAWEHWRTGKKLKRFTIYKNPPKGSGGRAHLN